VIPRVNMDELGLPGSTGKTLLMREVWTGEEMVPKNDTMYTFLKPYDCAVYRCKLIDKADVPENLRLTQDLEGTVNRLKQEGYTVPEY